MPVWEWIRSWISWVLANPILTPDSESLRRLGRVHVAGDVRRQRGDASLEMWEKPLGDLGIGVDGLVTEESDRVEPSVQRHRKGFDDQWARSIDENKVRDLLASANELVRAFKSKNAAGRPALIQC